jgi:hypothetical protein
VTNTGKIVIYRPADLASHEYIGVFADIAHVVNAARRQYLPPHAAAAVEQALKDALNRAECQKGEYESWTRVVMKAIGTSRRTKQ